MAEGGPDNVWIVEVGTQADGSFVDFVAAVSGNEPEVERTADGFDVAWTSPSSATVTFGWDASSTVEGREVAQSGFPRHQSPWGTFGRLETTMELAAEGSTLALDFRRRHPHGRLTRVEVGAG